jgi:hypothetical protein
VVYNKKEWLEHGIIIINNNFINRWDTNILILRVCRLLHIYGRKITFVGGTTNFFCDKVPIRGASPVFGGLLFFVFTIKIKLWFYIIIDSLCNGIMSIWHPMKLLRLSLPTCFSFLLDMLFYACVMTELEYLICYVSFLEMSHNTIVNAFLLMTMLFLAWCCHIT